jgi:hypothetical protein
MLPQADAGYINRPLIESVNYTIEADRVSIACSHTSWVNEARIKPLDKAELLTRYANVYRAAKAQNIKISFANHMRKKIIERWAEYENAIRSAGMVFDGLVEIAKAIRERGIHYGCGDDLEVAKLTVERNRHMEFHWRSNIITQITGIAHELRRLEQRLSSGNFGYGMIWL